MRISKKQLKSWSVESIQCSLLDRFIDQTNDTEEAVEISSLIGGKNTIGDLMWIAANLNMSNQLTYFILDIARLFDHLSPAVKACNDATAQYLKCRDKLKENKKIMIEAARVCGDTASPGCNSCKRAARAASWNCNVHNDAALTSEFAVQAGSNQADIDRLLFKVFEGGDK